MNSKVKDKISLIVNIAIPHIVSVIGSSAMSTDWTWYRNLNKPSFNPPSWVFGPVWFTLYTLIGIAFYLFHKKNQFQDKKVYALYAFHMSLNGIWSWLFFGLQQMNIALADILLMIFTLLCLMRTFYVKSRKSFYLLVPYLLWSCFACILSITIIAIN